MTIYIGTVDNNIINVAYNDEQKTYWQSVNTESTFTECDQTDTENFLGSKSSITILDNVITFSAFDDNPDASNNVSKFTKNSILEFLNEIKSQVEEYINNHDNTPASFNTSLTELNTLITNVTNDSAGINYDTTLDGVPASSAYGWTGPLKDAGTLVPLWLAI